MSGRRHHHVEIADQLRSPRHLGPDAVPGETARGLAAEPDVDVALQCVRQLFEIADECGRQVEPGEQLLPLHRLVDERSRRRDDDGERSTPRDVKRMILRFQPRGPRRFSSRRFSLADSIASLVRARRGTIVPMPWRTTDGYSARRTCSHRPVTSTDGNSAVSIAISSSSNGRSSAVRLRCTAALASSRSRSRVDSTLNRT